MTPTLVTQTLPAGFRFMFAYEAGQLDYSSPIRLLCVAGVEHGVVCGHTDEAITVLLRSGAKVTLDLDHPDYWPDGESRDRRPPMSPDGEVVAIRETGATPDEDVEPMLRASVALARQMKDDVELQAAVARLREIVNDRLTHRTAEAA